MRLALALTALGPILAIGQVVPFSSPQVRLGIIIEEPASAAAADVLTADLSHHAGIQLLERAEIERVYREQALSAANRDHLKLGQLLGADGLLLLRTFKENTNQFLQIRLVAVKPGVVLGSVRSPWPLADPSQWARGLVQHFEPLLPKLTVLAKDAVPISVVNLRSAVESPEGREVERQLTLLTIERLGHEQKLFLLERERMELLSGEKELQGVDDSAFWNGSYLLDGVVDQKGYSKETLTLSAQLAPPKGGAPLPLEIKGSRTNLSEVVNRLAESIIASLNLGVTGPAWSPTEEAGRFFEEAKWAYRWKLLPQARLASEASWALGNRSQEAAQLRIRCYLEGGLDTMGGSYDLIRKLVGFAAPPDNKKFALTRHGMELYCQDFQSFVAADPNPQWEWHDLGIDLLESASYWLRHYYFTPEARGDQELGVSSIQALAKEMAKCISQHPGYTNRWGQKNLLTTKANWGVYWTRTPEEGVSFYREILDAGGFAHIRPRFLEMDYLDRGNMDSPITDPNSHMQLRGGPIRNQMGLANPYLIGWTWTERKSAPARWRSFVDEVCASTNAHTRLEGLFLRAANSHSDEEYEENFRKLVAFIAQNRDMVIVVGMQEQLIHDLDLLTETKWKEDYRPIPFRMRGDVWKEAKQALQAPQAQTAKKPNLAEVQQSSTGAAVIATPAPTPRPQSVSGNQPILPKAPPLSSDRGIDANALTNLLTVKRFWPIPIKSLGANDPRNIHILSCCFREGHLWVDVRFDDLSADLGEPSHFNAGVIFAVDPDSLQSEPIILDPSSFQLSSARRDIVWRTDRSFEVYHGWLYVTSLNSMRRYSLKRKTWE
jgi:hypothetical protein